MKKTRSVQDVVNFLIKVSWFMGSGVIESSAGQPRFLISFLYSLTIVIVYAISLYFSTLYEDCMYLTKVNTTGSFLIKTITLGNALLAVFAIILAWNQRNGLQKSMKKILKADDLLQKMGITKDYDKTIKREIGNICAMFLIMIIVISINSYNLAVSETPFYKKAILIMSLHYPIILVCVADIIFLTIVKCMKRKFARLNALLKSMSATTPLSPQYMKLIYQKNGFLKQSPPELNKKTNDDTLLMKAAKQVHLELVKISRNINDTFGLQILLSMALSSVFVTGILYSSYTIAYKTKDLKVDKAPVLVSSCCWLFFYVMKILVINHICDRTSAEALLTGNIICELHEPMTSKEFRSEIREFVLQLIQNPLKFTAYDFVNLDYTLIQGIVGSITTYLVILIQLSSDFQDPANSKNATDTTN